MAPSPLMLDYLRTMISLSMLGYAAYKDLKTREIHDVVWTIPAILGLLIAVYEVYIDYLDLNQALISIGFMVVLSLGLWFFQLFGEADLLAFVALAVIHPRTPRYDFIGFTPLLFTFTLVANSALSGAFTAFYSLIKNLGLSLRGEELFGRHKKTSTLKKMGVMFTGLYKEITKIRGPPFDYPLEVRGELTLKPDIWDDKKARKEFRIQKEKGYERVWVSATLPYIVNLLVGYIISIVYGDILFSLMSQMMG